jgi:hypothetical protein
MVPSTDKGEITMTDQNTADLLNELNNSSASRLAILSDADYAKQKADIEAGYNELRTVRNSTERDIRRKILDATLKSLEVTRKGDAREIAQQLKEFGQAGGDLQELVNELMKPLPEEESLIKEAEGEVARAKEALAKTKDLIFFKNMRKESAQKHLQETETAVAEIQERVKAATYSRLDTQDTEVSLRTFKTCREKIVLNAKKGLSAIEGEINNISAKKEKAFATKIEAAKLLDQLEEEVKKVQAEYDNAQTVRDSIPRNTTPYHAQDKVVEDLNIKLEDLIARRNGAFMIVQEKDKEVKEEVIHHVTQMRAHQTQRLWILQALADAEKQETTFRSWISMMKTIPIQEMLAGSSAISADLNDRATSYMAQSQEAAQKNILKMIDTLPEQARKLKEVGSAQKESATNFTKHLEQAIQDFKNEYKEDPGIALGDDTSGENAPTEKTLDSDDILSSLR